MVPRVDFVIAQYALTLFKTIHLVAVEDKENIQKFQNNIIRETIEK